MKPPKLNKATPAGLLIAVGIVFGDLGTSPLYTFDAIVRGKPINELLVIGGASCVIWTLTMLTTVKYVVFAMRADNNGEGGIFSLYALIRRYAGTAVIFAMIGGAAMLANGLLTPPITVTSAVEGLQLPHDVTVKIVLGIIIALFAVQQFGTNFIGKYFGPIMFVWFSTMAIIGVSHLSDNWEVLKAFNPYYAIKLLVTYPKGFLILAAVFLCTTGAEALYADLGHCGRDNIRYSWIFVKICLILSYLGQAAWALQFKGEVIPSSTRVFFAIMPEWFVPFGIAIATMAAIIASQAMISGSFTLISEAIKLNLWPKMKIHYPTEAKGQLYIPGINLFLAVGCVLVVLFFKGESKNMEAAYGLAITVTMIMTTLMLIYYLMLSHINKWWVALFLMVYLTIESAFLFANIHYFMDGGYVTLIIGAALFLVNYVWYKARKIQKRYLEFVKLKDYLPQLQEVSVDTSIPKYSTHLVYLTAAHKKEEIEQTIMYSIFNKKPKRADIYWLLHVEVLDEPYRCDYLVDTIIPNEVIRITFRLGFRIDQKINLMFRRAVEEMVERKEVNIISRYESLSKNNVAGDFRFVVMSKFLSQNNDLPFLEKLVMKGYFYLKKISLSEERGFGLDSSFVTIEKFPLIIKPVKDLRLRRVYE
ncbi:MAG TPA: KUP/HAK/KT family potassium transporter [Chitinophagaceae bacterium]|nr:KUP/HAK/KT family potassium transporter [Chitinophagaceae bacterium]